MQRADAVLLFSPQGGQWPGMGMALYHESALFRAAFERCDASVREHFGWSLVEELLHDPSSWRLHERPDLLQPGLTALQIALAELVTGSGLQFAATMGLSMGEVAAAFASGSLGLDAAMRVVCTQARLTARPLRGGGMLAVQAGTDAVVTMLTTESNVAIAVELSPHMTVVAGETDSLERLRSHLANAGIGVSPLATSFAFHSDEMRPLHDEFCAGLADVRGANGGLPVYSAACAGRVSGAALNADHWWKIMSSPARFVGAVNAALDAGLHTFIEVGPCEMLEESVRAIASARKETIRYAALMRRGNGTLEAYDVAIAMLAKH